MDWNQGTAKTITFIVTKDCQLACKYCYLVGKNSNERMTVETAKQAVDFFLSQDFKEDSVIWEFIGGEPFLEIDLIDEVSDYIKFRMYELNHRWFDSYRFSFSTNGINYADEKVQSYITKNREHLSIGITIDGTKQKHDLNRVYKGSERGSYRDVVKNILRGSGSCYGSPRNSRGAPSGAGSRPRCRSGSRWSGRAPPTRSAAGRRE